MLFNSYEFLFVFFPLTVVGFFLIARRSHTSAAAWLALASLCFYAWWSVRAVPLLLASVAFNFLVGRRLVPAQGAEVSATTQWRKRILWLAIAANLSLLGFFKYANFFIDNANTVTRMVSGWEIDALHIVLPIGISFYTFTQIAFLVDCWQGKVRETRFWHYLLFVTYFPHLIAGPVLHHGQMMPQFARGTTYRLNLDHVTAGAAVFIVGLAKKLLIADPLGEHADLLFDSVQDGSTPMLLLSWSGTLAYTFQIYFDFSGYSDMAIGLSLFFGIQLPLNFNAPYRATSIIDFWRRWHISLSTFLRDYLYIPLGGSRLGRARRYFNLLITMVLGGLWHGANWTFVLWGTAHGVFLAINHLWREHVGHRFQPGRPMQAASWFLTFLCVVLAWVLFRADSVDSAVRIYNGMLGLNGVSVPADLVHVFTRITGGMTVVPLGLLQGLGTSSLTVQSMASLLLIAMLISLGFRPFAPQALQPATGQFAMRHNLGAPLALLFVVCVLSLGRKSSFLYFQF
jgi:alginate O-acetyltransferase complex protein AlgI